MRAEASTMDVQSVTGFFVLGQGYVDPSGTQNSLPIAQEWPRSGPYGNSLSATCLKKIMKDCERGAGKLHSIIRACGLMCPNPTSAPPRRRQPKNTSDHCEP